MTTLIIWDFDGTLADTRPWIYASYRYAARESGFPEPSDEQLSHHCCGGIFDNLEVLFGKTGEEAEAMAALYRKYYAENCMDKVCLFDGIRDMLHTLKERGYAQAVATMKIQPVAKELTENMGIGDCFVKVAGTALDHKVTKTQMIRECRSSGDYDRVVMVGDCPSDMHAAQNAGAEFIAAAYGYGFPEERCVSEGVEFIRSPAEMLTRFP